MRELLRATKSSIKPLEIVNKIAVLASLHRPRTFSLEPALDFCPKCMTSAQKITVRHLLSHIDHGLSRRIRAGIEYLASFYIPELERAVDAAIPTKDPWHTRSALWFCRSLRSRERVVAAARKSAFAKNSKNYYVPFPQQRADVHTCFHCGGVADN